MAVGEACRDECRKRTFGLGLESASALERTMRFIVATELGQHDRTIQMRFDVFVIELNRGIEFLDRGFVLSKEAEAESGQMADVGKIRVLSQDLPKRSEGFRVVAPFEGLTTLLNQLLEIIFHERKIARARGSRHSICGCRDCGYGRAANAVVLEAFLTQFRRLKQIASIDDDR